MLKHGNFWIRPVEKSDLDFLRSVRSDPSTWKQLGTFSMIGREDQAAWFDSLGKDRSKAYLVFGRGSVSMGYVRIADIDWINRSMSVGGDLMKKYRGKGYGKAMYRLIFDLGFQKWNMNRLWLKVMSSNRVAIALYKGCGFETEGVEREAILRDGQAVDYILMSILRREYGDTAV
jgi:RimJ/RimL family protein N-acetyltransferase